MDEPKPGQTGPGEYRDEVEIELLGRRVRVLDISREVSSTMPVYPGHVAVTFWDHLTHEQVRRNRLPEDSPFRGYAVRGIVASEHVSTHVDAVWHFNPDRPDLTIDRLPFEHLITPAAWIDLSDVTPDTHIGVDRVRGALEDAGIELRPGMTLLYYTGWGEPGTTRSHSSRATRALIRRPASGCSTRGSSTSAPTRRAPITPGTWATLTTGFTASGA